MRELTFLQCGPGAEDRARDWALEALRGAGADEAAARDGAGRLAEGVRAAAEAFACAEAGPQALLVLSDEGGALAFELVADGAPARARAALCAGPWRRAEPRAAGGGCFHLTMPALA